MIFALAAVLCINGAAQAQTYRYTISGGLLGAANYSKFRLKDKDPNTDYKYSWGYAGGVWANFPIANRLSIEVQPQYSRLTGTAERAGITTLDQDLFYISTPLFLKIDVGRYFAVDLGAQGDYLVKAKEESSGTAIDNKDLLKKFNYGVLGGVEFIPHGRVSIFAKYVHGLANIADNPASTNKVYTQQFQAGLKLKLFGKRIVTTPPPAPVVVVLDRDGDGVLDVDDRCPDVAGLAALKGCPDRDGDGIADIDDKCPDVPGVAKYNGCPIPDTDGDGINDEVDKCPTVKGLARYQGCPIPDTDNDGVNDEEDKCPTRPGPASNMGCPVIAKEVVDKVNFAAKNVFFATGSYKLLPKSYKSLDAVVDLLRADNSLMIDIDGHTDAQGTEESNQVLSDNRAGAVKNYLVSKGIDASRLKSTGYGETKPVADNNTAAGRAKNRRTEMTVRNF